MNEEEYADYLDTYYTKAGQEALKTRLEQLGKLYCKALKYPYQAQMFGFLPLVIRSKTHHEGMMEGLGQQLGITELKIEVKK